MKDKSQWPLDNMHGNQSQNLQDSFLIVFSFLSLKVKTIKKPFQKCRLAYSQGSFDCIPRTDLNSSLSKCLDMGKPQIPQYKA